METEVKQLLAAEFGVTGRTILNWFSTQLI
jgi:hypothetical protein